MTDQADLINEARTEPDVTGTEKTLLGWPRCGMCKGWMEVYDVATVATLVWGCTSCGVDEWTEIDDLTGEPMVDEPVSRELVSMLWPMPRWGTGKWWSNAPHSKLPPNVLPEEARDMGAPVRRLTA